MAQIEAVPEGVMDPVDTVDLEEVQAPARGAVVVAVVISLQQLNPRLPEVHIEHIKKLKSHVRLVLLFVVAEVLLVMDMVEI